MRGGPDTTEARSTASSQHDGCGIRSVRYGEDCVTINSTAIFVGSTRFLGTSQISPVLRRSLLSTVGNTPTATIESEINISEGKAGGILVQNARILGWG
jgi:hypothetical protein